MKLSELTACVGCGGVLLKPPQGNWYYVKTSLAMLSPNEASRVVGLTSMFRGNLLLAEVMGGGEDAVVIFGEADKTLYNNMHICPKCFYSKTLAQLNEAYSQLTNKEGTKK